MKKIVSVLLVICMIFVFAACSNDDNGTESTVSTEKDESSAASSEASAEQSVEESKVEESSEEEPSDEPSEEQSEEQSVEEPSEEVSKEESEEVSVEEPADQTQYYVLGDSISYGAALENPEEMCFASLFAKEVGNMSVHNLAISGHTSEQLLAIVNSTSFADADFITFCIGANDLIVLLLSEMIPLLEEIIGEPVSEDLELSTATLAKLMKTESLQKINDVFNSDEFMNKCDAVLVRTKANIKTALQKIRNDNADCTVFVLNVYNPAKGIKLQSLNAEEIFKKYIAKLNVVIEEEAAEFGLKCIDVSKAFEDSKDDLVNAALTLLPKVNINIDPHPNALGHEVIKQLILDEWNKK